MEMKFEKYNIICKLMNGMYKYSLELINLLRGMESFMYNFLENIKEFFIRNYYTFLYVGIFVFSLFQGRIISWYSKKNIEEHLDFKKALKNDLKKDMLSTYETVQKLKVESIKESKLEESMTEYYNCLWKSRMYFTLGIVSLPQLIILMLGSNVDRVSANLSILTITISFIEYRDNKLASKKIKKEVDYKLKQLVEELIDIQDMAINDFIKNKLIKQS